MAMEKLYLRDFLRYAKRLFLGTTKEILGGREFVLAYEARTLRQEDDYSALHKLAINKSCVFDVGANIGRTSLLMSTVLNPNGKIIAFEASEYTCRIMIENIRRNKMTEKIFPVNALVSDASGNMVDFFWEFSSGGASPIFGFLGHKSTIPKVTLSLDDFINESNNRPELIKIDVEGGEKSVIVGLRKTLSTIRPILSIEIHSWKNKCLTDNFKEIQTLLYNAAYKIYDLNKKCIIDDKTGESLPGARYFIMAIPEENDLPSGFEN
jgi:FkbM family methyltransferase